MSKYLKILLSILAVTVVLNILAFSKGFCDFYTDYVYVHIANGYGWVMDLIPFPVGEILMYLGIILLVFVVVFGISYLFLKKKPKGRLFIKNYMKTMVFVGMVMLFLYTVLWFVPFRGRSIEAKLDQGHTYTTKELIRCRAYVVNQINDIAKKVDRDKKGHMIYPENVEALCKKALAGISGEYPRLRGHYPTMKKAYCSDFLEWMYIGGYTYPYTMEITNNRYITKMYYPTLYLHEMAHHKGYYKESDANFVSFLAGSSSEDLFLQYSAYLEIYYYLDDTYMDYVFERDTEELWDEYEKQPALSELVENDISESHDEKEEVYQESVNPVLEENFSSYAQEVSNVGWETQAEILDEFNYDGVVRLVMEYYDGILY